MYCGACTRQWTTEQYAGIVAMIFAWYVAEHDLAGRGVVAAVAVAGLVVMVGSLARHRAGR